MRLRHLKIIQPLVQVLNENNQKYHEQVDENFQKLVEKAFWWIDRQQKNKVVYILSCRKSLRQRKIK